MDQPRPGNDTHGDGADPADERLRRRLVAVDPASALTPTDPARVDRLLEDLMGSPHPNADVEESADGSSGATVTRATGTRHRSPLTWLVAAAALVLIGGVGLFALVRHDDLAKQADQTDRVPAAGSGSTTTLEAPGPAAYQARCAVPTPERLAQQPVAFAGTVSAVSDDTVTLAPTRFYAGEPTDLVRVEAPAADLDLLVGAVDFEQGGRYLVSASGGQVTVCGFSGPYSERLAGLYAQAFPGEG